MIGIRACPKIRVLRITDRACELQFDQSVQNRDGLFSIVFHSITLAQAAANQLAFGSEGWFLPICSTLAFRLIQAPSRLRKPTRGSGGRLRISGLKKSLK